MDIFNKNRKAFNLLYEGISEGIIVVNENKSIITVNSSLAQMFSYNSKELIGKPLNQLIPQEYHTSHNNHFKNFYANSNKRKMGVGKDLHGVRKNGELFPVEIGLNAFKISNRTYIVAFIIDITERKSKEQELSHWSEIFSKSLNEIYIFDSKTFKFIDVNYGAQNNLGYTLEELKKLTVHDIATEFDNIDKLKELFDPLLRKEISKIQIESQHQRKDGSIYPIEVHLQLSNINNVDVFVAIILDITMRKNYTRKLEKTVAERTKELKEALVKEKELNELKTKFLNLVSHEFKTPLSGILTSVMLINKYSNFDQQKDREKHLKIIKGKINYLNDIVDDFMSLVRLTTGDETYNFTKFNLSTVVNDVVYNANMLLKNGQNINMPENFDEYTLFQDEKVLKVILTRLLNNAIKYSSEHSNIDFKIKQEGKFIVFTITDHGIGIPEEEQKFITDKYFRAENVLNQHGTGIALNIVKTHLKNLGGKINFKSKFNFGSTFIAKVPISKKVIVK